MFNIFNTSDKIVKIPLNGIIENYSSTGADAHFINESLNSGYVRNAKMVILEIDSPGGSPTEAEKISQIIKSFRDREKIPIIAFIDNVCCSAAYWVASACEAIYALKTSVVGSIGVILDGKFDLSAFIEKFGIKRRVYTAGSNKNMLDMFEKSNEEHDKIINSNLDKLHEVFIEEVKNNRKELINSEEFPDVFTGAFFTGEMAKDRGLVDKIGYYVDILNETFGYNQYNLINIVYRPRISFWRSILGKITKSFLAKIKN